MFKMSARSAAIRTTLLAGAVAAGLGGLTATAQAFPGAAPIQAAAGYEDAQYYGDGDPYPMRHHRHRHGYDHYGPGYGDDRYGRGFGRDHGGYGHHRYGHASYGHHRYGENAHPRHPGHAGLYDCGPGGKATRLSRKACGGNDRFRHLDQPY